MKTFVPVLCSLFFVLGPGFCLAGGNSLTLGVPVVLISSIVGVASWRKLTTLYYSRQNT